MSSQYQKETRSLINILKHYKPKKIILFGSAVSKKNHSQSDIDVCLIKNFKTSKLNEKKKIFDLLWRQKFNYLFDPDIHIYQPNRFQSELKKENPFVMAISQGKIVYEQ